MNNRNLSIVMLKFILMYYLVQLRTTLTLFAFFVYFCSCAFYSNTGNWHAYSQYFAFSIARQCMQVSFLICSTFTRLTGVWPRILNSYVKSSVIHKNSNVQNIHKIYGQYLHNATKCCHTHFLRIRHNQFRQNPTDTDICMTYQ